MKRYHWLPVANFHQDRWLADTVLCACRVNGGLERESCVFNQKTRWGSQWVTRGRSSTLTPKDDITACASRTPGGHKLTFRQLRRAHLSENPQPSAAVCSGPTNEIEVATESLRKTGWRLRFQPFGQDVIMESKHNRIASQRPATKENDYGVKGGDG